MRPITSSQGFILAEIELLLSSESKSTIFGQSVASIPDLMFYTLSNFWLLFLAKTLNKFK